MKKTLLLGILVVVAVIVSGAFYGGMKYAQTKAPAGFAQEDFQDFRNLSPEERQQRLEQLGANMGAGFRNLRRGSEAGANFVGGEIITKDVESIVLKLPDGGSKIVFFSESTEITKSVDGSTHDLTEGKQVVISGKENPDGSYTAETIQLGLLGRPQ